MTVFFIFVDTLVCRLLRLDESLREGDLTTKSTMEFLLIFFRRVFTRLLCRVPTRVSVFTSQHERFLLSTVTSPPTLLFYLSILHLYFLQVSSISLFLPLVVFKFDFFSSSLFTPRNSRDSEIGTLMGTLRPEIVLLLLCVFIRLMCFILETKYFEKTGDTPLILSWCLNCLLSTAHSPERTSSSSILT